MKKQKPVKESAKVKVDIKALKKLLKKIDLKSSVVGLIGLIVLVGILTSTYNYITINPGGAQTPPPDLLPIDEPIYQGGLCRLTCRRDPGEIAITCYNDWQGGPAIYGDIVVWEDVRDSDFGYTSIYLKDLSDPNYPRYGKKLTNNYRGETTPDIYQNLVVWADYRNGQLNMDIYMYDLATGGPATPITANAIKDQANPKIDGNFIVWEDYRDDPTPIWSDISDIYAYDLTTGETIRVTNTPDISEVQPSVSGNLVTFAEIDIVNHVYLNRITIFNLDTRTIVKIIVPIFYQLYSSPVIDAGKVAWIGRVLEPPYTYHYNIFVEDVITGNQQALYKTPPPGLRMAAIQIHNNLLVWEDYRHRSDGPEIYFSDLGTISPNLGIVDIRITDDPFAQVQPAIYGNKIVWTDYRNVPPYQPWPDCPYDANIFMREIS